MSMSVFVFCPLSDESAPLKQGAWTLVVLTSLVGGVIQDGIDSRTDISAFYFAFFFLFFLLVFASPLLILF